MASSIVYPNGNDVIILTAGQSIAVYTTGDSQATVSQNVGYPNHPPSLNVLATMTNKLQTFGPYAGGASIQIDAGADEVLYQVGLAPTVPEAIGGFNTVGTSLLNATGALTGAMIASGIVASTTAAAVVATLPTGAVMITNGQFGLGDGFFWSAINTGANAFTVTAAASEHTVVGAGAVAAGTSGRFLTKLTALPQTFITFRVA